jgi:hypothetical protein
LSLAMLDEHDAHHFQQRYAAVNACFRRANVSVDL